MADLTLGAGNMAQPTSTDLSPQYDPCSRYLAYYAQHLARDSAVVARQALLDALTTASEQDWLTCGQRLVLQIDFETARAVFTEGVAQYPHSNELSLALAGICWQGGQAGMAEAQLHELLARQPDHVAATFLLVRILKEQGRLQTAGKAMRRLFEQTRQDADTVIQAVEMLDDVQRTEDAAAICEMEIAAGCIDPRIHAYAGMLGIQLGHFELVRERYTFALEHSPQAVEWNIPIGLSTLQRYRDGDHPDFPLFRDVLQQPGLSEKARTLTLFALGKAHDDIGDHALAAQYLRQANALAHARSTWSRKHWRRLIEARLASKPLPFQLPDASEWTPLFIVGVPRSGTTLLAELLARHPLVCNRGELGWLATLMRQLEQTGTQEPAAYEQAAAIYAAQLRQDNSDARWFIDKQPLNLLHVDRILTLWPNARIIHCRRNSRDTALSLWSQSFHDHAHDYAYDFNDIATVIQGCERLMVHWRARYAASIHTVRYEALTTDPERCLNELARWLGLPGHDLLRSLGSDHAISTASTWQARQPIHAHSVARWRAYAPHVPELLRLADK